MPDDSGSGAAMVSELSVPCTKCVYPSARPRRRLAALSPPHEIAARLSRGTPAVVGIRGAASALLLRLAIHPPGSAHPGKKNFVHGTPAATGYGAVVAESHRPA